MKLLRSFSETAILLLVAVTAAHAVQWPLQPVDQTHSIYHGYGNYHRPWTDTTHVNFHYGIDIADPDPGSIFLEPVHAVEKGTVRRVEVPPELYGWLALCATVLVHRNLDTIALNKLNTHDLAEGNYSRTHWALTIALIVYKQLYMQ